MKHERNKRRVLYGLTVWAWLICGHFIWAAIHYESVDMRIWLMVTLIVAATLSTASLFAAFVAPLEHVYRAGYEARERANEHLPVRRGVNHGGVVIPLRPVRLTHADN